nr:hypothetical protein [uncultured Anaerocolumna sp.]
MNLIKAKFLRDGEPQGRAYTYIANENVKVGDLVQLNERGQGIVIETDVPESEVESFRDRLKTIIGKVEAKDTEAADNESEAVLDE